MTQTINSQSLNEYQITDEELRSSITNINEIMQKINQTVRKTEVYMGQNDIVGTFVTQQNLITENIQADDSDLVRQLKIKINSMKIPLHQLHKKNKLSTVIQESRSQSGRTNPQNITPRQVQPQNAVSQKQNIVPSSFIKEMYLSTQNANNERIQYDQGNKMPKKITGIRKMNKNKFGQISKLTKLDQVQKDRLNKGQKIQSQMVCSKKITKAKSMVNIKDSKHQHLDAINLPYNRQNQSQQNTLRSKSRPKKGLSVISKSSLKSEQSETNLNNKCFTIHMKHKTADGVSLSSQKKLPNQKCIKVKKSIITPFIVSKKSIQFNKKAQPKPKNCLTRTNIRQFFTSKRINK